MIIIKIFIEVLEEWSSGVDPELQVMEEDWLCEARGRPSPQDTGIGQEDTCPCLRLVWHVSTSLQLVWHVSISLRATCRHLGPST